MITDLLPWIKDGIRIDGLSEGGYEVFTVPTQHFHVNSLDEITPERFEFEVEKRAKCEEMIREYLKQNDSNMENKYKSLPHNYFGFQLFEEIFKVINERGYQHDDQMFKAGVASAEAAVRRLREEYYEAISTAPF
jgi:hypothetical protein